MKKLIIIALCYSTLLTSGCYPQRPLDPNVIPNKRYEIERLSFLPPKGDSWRVSTNSDNDGIVFNSSRAVGSSAIEIGSIHIGSFCCSTTTILDEMYRKQLAWANEENRSYEKALSGKYKTLPYCTAKIINKYGSECVRRRCYDTDRVSDGGVYFCAEPNKPKDYPMFYIASPYPDQVLDPVWSSLEFRQFDPNSPAYLGFLKRSQEIKERKKITDQYKKNRTAYENK